MADVRNRQDFCTIDFRDSDEPERISFGLGRFGIPDVPNVSFSRRNKILPTGAVHRHPGCWEVAFCLRGVIPFIPQETAPASLKAHEALIVGETCTHCFHVLNKNAIFFSFLLRRPAAGKPLLGLSTEESRALVRRLNKCVGRVLNAPPDIDQIAHAILDCRTATRQKPLLRLRLRTLLLSILAQLLENRPASAIFASKSVSALADEIRRDPGQRLTSAEMRRRTGLSGTSLNEAFKSLTGYPPHMFVLHTRLAHAEKTLRGKKCPSVSTLADTLGFSSDRHFIAQFKSRYGTTPGRLRNNAV